MTDTIHPATELADKLARQPVNNSQVVLSWKTVEAAADELRQVADLRARLDEALEEMRDMVAYVPDYFREKWGYDETIARLAGGDQ